MSESSSIAPVQPAKPLAPLACLTRGLLRRLWAAKAYYGTCFAVGMVSGGAYAQALDASGVGQGILTAACSFLRSPIVIFAFVVGILLCVFALVLNEGKGVSNKVVLIATAGAVVMSLGTIVGLILNKGNVC